jgi:hypothetical protein
VAAATVTHYLLFRNVGFDARSSLVWIWLPVLILGGVVECLSFALKAGKASFPLFNRRLGSSILGGLAWMVVITVLVVRLALTALSPGLALLLASLPMVFYAQLSYASLFFEAFAGISVGLLLEFGGARGPLALAAAGLATALLYAIAGVHVGVIERRGRG